MCPWADSHLSEVSCGQIVSLCWTDKGAEGAWICKHRANSAAAVLLNIRTQAFEQSDDIAKHLCVP